MVRDLTPRSIAAELRINTSRPGDQYDPEIAALKNGDLVVSWTSDNQDGSVSSVQAQLYTRSAGSVDGYTAGGAFEIGAASTGNHYDPSVTALAGGGFVVSWTSDTHDSVGADIYARRYDAAGQPDGEAFRVNETLFIDHQYASTTAAFPGGGFIVSWVSLREDASGADIFAQRYDPAGRPDGGALRIATVPSGYPSDCSIQTSGDGGFAVSWTAAGEDGVGIDNHVQRFTPAGQPDGAFRVNAAVSGYSDESSIRGLRDGSFVVSWTADSEDGTGCDVYARRFTAHGEIGGEIVKVNAVPSEIHERPVITALEDGGFLISWDSGQAVHAQRYTAEGGPAGSEFVLVSQSARPAIAALSGSDFIVGWGASEGGRIGYDVYAQRFALPALNESPVAADVSAGIREGATVQGRLSASDADGDALTYVLVTGPAKGTLALSPDGAFTYSAGRNVTGADTFTFKATDGKLDSGIATVSISIDASPMPGGGSAAPLPAPGEPSQPGGGSATPPSDPAKPYPPDGGSTTPLPGPGEPSPPGGNGGGSPSSWSTMVDGTPVTTEIRTNPDGSRTQIVTIPTVAGQRQDQHGTPGADVPLIVDSSGHSLLTAAVPAGIGLRVQGPPVAATAAASVPNLISEIRSHLEEPSHQNGLADDASAFLSSLPDGARVLVQTFVPLASASVAPAQPLILSAPPFESGGVYRVVVIDAQDLAAGIRIELHNIELAVVLGDATVAGGAGSRMVLSDSASQTIVLGAEDDVIDSGGGDDMIGSGAGNDRILGGSGNDTVCAGEGDDFVDGGSGTDTLLLAGRDRNDYSIRFENGRAVLTHRDGDSDGRDVAANIELIRFTGADLRPDAVLDRLYESILSRPAEAAGKSSWMNAHENGLTMHDIAASLLRSAEAEDLHGQMSNQDYVAALYRDALDRPADRDGLLGWTGALESGAMDRAAVLLSFANSAEKLAARPITFDFNHSEAATLVRLYDTLFDRLPDQAGINHWLAAYESGMSLHDIAQEFLGSPETQDRRGTMSNEDYIDMLYQGALGRHAEAEGKAHWMAYLANAGDRADMLLGLANSIEKLELTGVINSSVDLT